MSFVPINFHEYERSRQQTSGRLEYLPGTEPPGGRAVGCPEPYWVRHPRPLDPFELIEDPPRFLGVLGGPDTVFHFRAIPERGNAGFTRNLQGKFSDVRERLESLNQCGYGIFVVINETGGPADRDVTDIRAVFVDYDTIVSGAELEIRKERLEYFCGVAPVTLVRKGTPGLAPVSMAVESSPGKFHVYWRTHGFPIGRFKWFQQGLAAVLNSDPAVCNPSRVMRVPGFLHQKNEPFRSRLVFTRNGFPYSAHFDDLEKALTKTAKKFKVKVQADRPPPTSDPVDPLSPEALRRVNGILGRVEAAEPGERNPVLFWAGCVFAEMALPGEAWDMLSEAAQLCGLSKREIRSTISSARRKVAS